MRATHHQTERERQAQREVGTTDVQPAVAVGLVAAFLTLIIAVGALQISGYEPPRRQLPGVTGAVPLGPRPDTGSACNPLSALADARRAFATGQSGFVSRVVAANRTVLARLGRCEEELEDGSVVGRVIRPPIQSLLARTVGVGNEQVYLGRDGWLFYRSDIDHVVGPGFLEPAQRARRVAGAAEWRSPPQPDPRTGILHFRDQLARRGIDLVVMPTPVKPTIHPEYFAGAGRASPPIDNRSFDRFVSELEAAGVTVFDPAPLLAELPSSAGTPAYLATDTHWTPEGMERAASALAALIEPRLPGTAAAEVRGRRRTVTVRGTGDLLSMLDVDVDDGRFAAEAVDVHPVEAPPPARGDGPAVLLLGDSFSNIYAFEAMGWGSGAGLADQLAFELRQPVDRLIRNDNGSYATREALARELAQGRNRLASTRIVVYQFATRELSFGDWKLIELPAARTPDVEGFVAVSAGAFLDVEGTIAAASPVPEPANVPYRDHVRTLHLVDVTGTGGAQVPGEALVHVRSMADATWTAAATWQSGDRVALRLRAWDDVADEVDGFNRSELFDERLLQVTPVWGEPRPE